jgi:hypothetical protein
LGAVIIKMLDGGGSKAAMTQGIVEESGGRCGRKRNTKNKTPRETQIRGLGIGNFRTNTLP